MCTGFRCAIMLKSCPFEDASREEIMNFVPFKSTLAKHNLELVRNDSHTLQLNLGLLCNQLCRHCHLDAGPGRRENMNLETVEAVVNYAERNDFETIDITGGAPELNPNLGYLIEKISPFASMIMLRSNLSALKDKFGHLIDLLKSTAWSLWPRFLP